MNMKISNNPQVLHQTIKFFELLYSLSFSKEYESVFFADIFKAYFEQFRYFLWCFCYFNVKLFRGVLHGTVLFLD